MLGAMTRRLAVVAVGLAVLGLAGCEGGGEKAAEAKEIHVYNWSDYIDPKLLEEFTAETGIKVVYDTFDTAEIMETKLMTGQSGYDVAVPANHTIPKLIQGKAIEPLDFALLPNRKNLWPDIVAGMEPFDPGAKYSVPYMWGTMGIGYNKAKVAERLPGVALDSWSVIFDPANLAKLKDCGVFFLDAPEDMFAVVLTYLGKDPNSTNPADYEAAAQLLLKLRPYVRKFHSSEYIEALANGDACVVVGYNGDIFQARDRAEEAKNGVNIGYIIPKEGSQLWFDAMTIPVGGNREAAHKFINFMMRPEIIARASNVTTYANGNLAAAGLVDADIKDNPGIYPPPEVMSRLFTTKAKDQALMKVVTRQWTKVLTGR
ncbi:polyamine ABC transporter substrate-binding protein [Caulobacter sp. SLTY]|uniref:polyamine ABC transporter substrate-binding protein n=1 Tax=Caulobacter sp. SLTY TaxID=2683262 RepID=UPI001F0E5F8F|nr:polyamine ABC transporter substrate-binding protein [Caulobacter sp. SLTY]